MRPRYRLAALERLEKHCVEERRALVASKALRVQRTTNSRVQCEAELEAERGTLNRVLNSEAVRLVSGQARALDMLRSQEFALGAQKREAEHQVRLEQARRQEQQARSDELSARAALLDAQGQVRALSQHRARFEREQARASEAEWDDAVLDVHAHRSRGRP